MRLHSLDITAIGPFPGTHHIDFVALTAGGLFLLEGPTGAGKSTIIDAVVFALYGETASSASSRDRLTSRHAVPGTAPVVELVFETGAGVYRVRRSPEHMRPKQRGTGLTKEQAQVRLWRLSDPDEATGVPLSTRVGEADAEILRIVGLSREQFVQTVVLPQGEFATFLRATPEERRAVLQRLFGTEIYQRMQDRLVEAARTARRAADAARADARGAIQAFVRAASPSEPASLAAELRPGAAPRDVELLVDRLAQMTDLAETPEEAKLTALAAEVVEDFESRADSLAGAERRAQERERIARSACDSARVLAGRLETRSRLRSERTALDARLPEIAGIEARLAAARRAGGVLPSIHAASAAASALRDAGAAMDELRVAVAAGADADSAEEGSDLPAILAQAQHDRGALVPALSLEAGLAKRQDAVESAGRALAADRAEREAARTDLAARPTRRAEIEAGLAVPRERANRATTTGVRLERAVEVLAAAEAATRLATKDARVRELLGRRKDEAGKAVARLSRLRLQRIAEIAGELAEGLRPGDPCPVCGGLEHPAPARRADGAVSAADVSAAEAACTRAESALAQARDDAAELGSQLRAARAAGGDRSVEAAANEVGTLRRALDNERAAAAAVAAGEQVLLGFDAATEDLRGRFEQLGAAVATARERLATAEQDHARDTAAVTAARGSWTTVAERYEALAARVAAAEALQAATDSLAVARLRHDEQAGVLAEALAEAGFPRADDAAAAVLDAAAYRRCETELQSYRSARARVLDGLAESAIAALDGSEVADVAGTAAALEAATSAYLDAARLAAQAHGDLQSVRRHAEALTAALAADVDATASAAPIRRMAELASAGEANERHHTLATFVLLRRFEEVVAAANLRLTAMSDGRYTLARTDEREGGVAARRAGLGLVVEDHLVGDRRAPRTLSGGETFYVSLCLALGLADVVRAEAGGVDLGTLFIDEGFGSLDPDTLDTVLRELGRLRSGGRVVGIVSHVAELKRRVAERIEVRRRPDGSSTLAVIA